MLNLPPIVTSGVDSEYVLSGLSHYLRSAGYEVYELDFATFHDDPVPLLKSLRKNAIYITSAHTNLTCTTANYLVPEFPKIYPNYLAPIEIIPILNPKLSIYIPHDLLTPYGDTNLAELRFLDLFDHILVPTSHDKRILETVLPPSTQIHCAGWIKYVKKDQILSEQRTFPILLFISMIGHLRARYGADGIVDYLRPLLTPETYIKLPAWKNVDLIEEALRKQTQAQVIPSDENSITLIQQAELVVCNGASSIHAEATLMRKPTVCLLDVEGVTPAFQRKKLQHLDNIYFHDYSQKAPIPRSLVTQLKQQCKKAPLEVLQPFSYQAVLSFLCARENA